MAIKELKDMDCAGKIVVIRQDLNVPMKDGRITNDKRIRAALPGIRLALEKGAGVVLLSHLGRPTEGEFDPKFSLAPVAEHLAGLLGKAVPLASDIDSVKVAPGEVVIGADSHTCTYGALGAFSTGVGSTDMAAGMATGLAWFKVPSAIKVTLKGKFQPYVSGKDVILHLIGAIGVDGALYQSLEFTGEGVAELSMDDRFTIANMAIEAGAKNGIFPVDDKTRAYLSGRVDRPWTAVEADPDAVYEREVVIDLSALRPTVALPHLPSNTRTVDQVAGTPIQQVVIGSCTNGRLEDLRQAAAILKGRKVHDGVRCIVLPATQQIMLDAMAEGLIQAFIEAGCAVSTPTCGPCLGGHMGVLSNGERAISTTNRNFVGRMGPVDSEIILASPAVAAASAVTGVVTDPAAL